jgi:ferredoxin
MMSPNKGKFRVVIDRDLCVGSGLCVATDSQRFAIGPDGKAEYSSETVDIGLAEEAVELCPQSAIRLESEDDT